MIPPLVAFLATVDAKRERSMIDQLIAADPSAQNEIRDRFASVQSLPPLAPRALVPDRPAPNAISRLIETITLEQLIPGFSSRADALSVKAAIFQLHDFLDPSHDLAQEADNVARNRTGPFWHGIMHRREPDYDNARYWFRRVGAHPTFRRIATEVAPLFGDRQFANRLRHDGIIDQRGEWDPMAFIDVCEECGREKDDRASAAAELQAVEMRVLLEFTCAAAMGAA